MLQVQNHIQCSDLEKDNETGDRIYRAHPVPSILTDMGGNL